MAAQEITFKLNVDPAVATAEIRRFTQTVQSGLKDVSTFTKQEMQAAVSLQKQRSAALISEWKREKREEESESRRQASAEASLQRQRSQALIAQWKSDQRERIRIERETQRERERLERQAQAESQRASQRSSAFLAGAVGGVTALVGISAVSTIREAASAWVDYASKLQTTRIAFTQMLGSAQAAEDHLKELQAFALKTPFQFKDLIDASQRMQALGFRAEQVIPVLTDVGNAVAAAGGGAERLDRVVLALSQMQSKGRVATQELNQLAESGIGGFKILQEATGKTRAELVKMVEAGEVSSKTFLDAFQKFSQIHFGGLMEEQSRTFTGAMSNIKDALLQTSATAFAPLFEKLSQTARHFSEASAKSDEFKRKLETVGSFAATVWDGAGEAIQILKDAYRLSVTVITSVIGAYSHALESAVRVAQAFYHGTLANILLLRGDLVGALRESEKATRALTLAKEAATDVARAELKIIQELKRIYDDAAASAKRLADEQAKITVGTDISNTAFQRKVGVDIGVGAGILRKKAGDEPLRDTAAKGADPAATAQRIAELTLANTVAGLNAEESAIKRSLKLREIDFAEYAAKVTLLETSRHIKAIAGLVVEENAARELRKGNQRTIQLAEIENKRLQEEIRHKNVLNEIDDKRSDIAEQITDAIAKQAKAISEAAGQTSHWQRSVDDLIESLKKQGATLTSTQEFWLRFNAALAASKERAKELIEALKDVDNTNTAIKAKEAVGGTFKSGILIPEKPVVGNVGTPPPPEIDKSRSAIDQLFEAANENLTGAKQQAALAGLEAMTGAFGDLGHAVGSVVEAFVLYGSAGTSVRKVTAEIIAGVARQAAIKAVFELAEGFAALALAFFGLPNAGPSASAHFTAAAIYGAIAGVAAIAGRAVAGDAFKQAAGPAATTGARSSSGSGGGSSGTKSPAPVNIDRNVAGAQAITHEVTFKVKGDVVVDEFVRDYDLNGRTRIKIISDGQG